MHGSEKAFVHVFLSMGIKWHGKNRNKKRCGQRGGKNKKTFDLNEKNLENGGIVTARVTLTE